MTAFASPLGGTRHLATNVIFLLLVLTPSGTCSFSELGHVNKYSWVDSERLGWSTVYSKRDLLLSSWQQRSSHVSRFWVATNSFAAWFWVYCDTVGFCRCVLGRSLVVVLVGLLPRSLFALLSFGWWDANLAGGSASCLVFLICVLVVMICQAACDHGRPCSSFLTNSFFSCKDRALERDRPYQRGKKRCTGGTFMETANVLHCSALSISPSWHCAKLQVKELRLFRAARNSGASQKFRPSGSLTLTMQRGNYINLVAFWTVAHLSELWSQSSTESSFASAAYRKKDLARLQKSIMPIYRTPLTKMSFMSTRNPLRRWR